MADEEQILFIFIFFPYMCKTPTFEMKVYSFTLLEEPIRVCRLVSFLGYLWGAQSSVCTVVCNSKYNSAKLDLGLKQQFYDHKPPKDAQCPYFFFSFLGIHNVQAPCRDWELNLCWAGVIITALWSRRCRFIALLCEGLIPEPTSVSMTKY